MTSYFEIYDYQENKTMCIPGKAQTKKQTRSVLAEISQNTQKRQKRIIKSDGYQVFSEHSWGNSLIHPIAETSQAAEESHQSLSSFLLSDNKADDLNKRIVSVTSDDSSVFQDDGVDKVSLSSKNSYMFQDDGVNKASLHSNDSSVFQDDRLDKISLPSNNSSVFQDNSLEHVSLRSNNSSVFQDESMVKISFPSSEFQDDNMDHVSLPAIKENITQDLFTVPEYSQGIYQFLKDSELRRMPKWNYMERQTDITFNMRAILVDWLVEVAEEYKLKTETVYLAVSYKDRFLSKMCVVRSKLQLVGTACMFIAAKYEEIYPPGVEEFTFITSDSYTKKQVLRMEQLVLKVLGFDVSMPTSHEFVNHNCQMFHMVGKALHLTQYINELSLLDGRTFLKIRPSVVAASSVVLARHTLGIPAWTDAMAAQTGYSLNDLKECVVGLYEAFTAAQTSLQQTILKKYNQDKFSNVAKVSPVDIM